MHPQSRRTVAEIAVDQARVNTGMADEILARSEAYHSSQVDALDACETAKRVRQRLASGNGL